MNKIGAKSLLHYLACFGRPWTEIVSVGRYGDHPGKVDLLDPQEDWELSQVFNLNDISVKHRGTVDLDEFHGEKGISVNFHEIRLLDLVSIEREAQHHGADLIKHRDLAGLFVLNLKGFRSVGDENGLVRLIGGRWVYFVGGSAFAHYKR